MMYLTLLILAMATPAFADNGVMGPDGEELVFQDRATSISNGKAVVQQSHLPDKFANHVQAQLPADDRGQWYITVFSSPNSSVDALLRRDFRESPALKALADWGTVQIIDYTTEANRERWAALGVKYTPTVLVYPRPGHPRLQYRCAIAQEGYGGDADRLARSVYAAIRKIYTKYNINGTTGPCPGPYCPQPNQPNRPWQPNRPDNDSWPPPVPVPNVPGGGFDFNFGLGWLWSLVGFVVKALVALVVLAVGVALAPKLLIWVIRKIKEIGREIVSAAIEPTVGQPGNSGSAREGSTTPSDSGK